MRKFLIAIAVLLSIEDGVYQWEYPRFGNIKMKRIFKLPEHAKTSPDRSHAL